MHKYTHGFHHYHVRFDGHIVVTKNDNKKKKKSLIPIGFGSLSPTFMLASMASMILFYSDERKIFLNRGVKDRTCIGQKYHWKEGKGDPPPMTNKNKHSDLSPTHRQTPRNNLPRHLACCPNRFDIIIPKSTLTNHTIFT